MYECRRTGCGTSFVFTPRDILEEVPLEVALRMRHAHLLLGLPRAVRVLQTDAVTATQFYHMKHCLQTVSVLVRSPVIEQFTAQHHCRLVVKSPET